MAPKRALQSILGHNAPPAPPPLAEVNILLALLADCMKWRIKMALFVTAIARATLC